MELWFIANRSLKLDQKCLVAKTTIIPIDSNTKNKDDCEMGKGLRISSIQIVSSSSKEAWGKSHMFSYFVNETLVKKAYGL